jgi:hypothetical protein
VQVCLFLCCDVLRGVYNFCSWRCCGYIGVGGFASLLFVNNTSARDPPDVTSLLQIQTCGSCAMFACVFVVSNFVTWRKKILEFP